MAVLATLLVFISNTFYGQTTILHRQTDAFHRLQLMMARKAALLSALLLIQLIVPNPTPAAAFTPEAISQISNLAGDALSSGSFIDLSEFGLDNWGMSSKLFSWLQEALADIFKPDGSKLATAGIAAVSGGLAGAVTGGLAGSLTDKGPFGVGPPMLPPLPSGHPLAPWASKHDKVLHHVADKFTGALVKAQFSPGLQAMLKITGLDHLEEALIKWICILYPWKGPIADAVIPDAISTLRDSYCVKALPAAAVSKLLPPPPGGLMGGLGPKMGGPGGLMGGPGGILGSSCS